MNIDTKTLASELLAIADAILTGRSALSARESASRLLAQHDTLTKQDERIAELERQLSEMGEQCQSWADSSRDWKAKADRYWQELETLKAEASNDEQAELAAWELLRDAKKELDEWKDKLDASELTHAATRADLHDCKLALQAERALADRLANELSCLADWRDAYGADCHYDPSALAAWKEARRE